MFRSYHKSVAREIIELGEPEVIQDWVNHPIVQEVVGNLSDSDVIAGDDAENKGGPTPEASH